MCIGVTMLSVNRVNVVRSEVPHVNFKADRSQLQYYQLLNEPQQESKTDRIKNKLKNTSVAQVLGLLSSGIIIAFFGLMLHREVAASRAQKKIASQLKKAGEKSVNSIEEAMKNCKNEQIVRAVAEEYAKGPMMMSNKKLQALAELSQIPDEAVKVTNIDNARKILDEEIIGMDGIKKQVLEFLKYRNKCLEQGIKPDKPLVISLDGPAGTAKTTIGRAIAKAAGLPHKEINMAGATGKSKVIGNESVYTGASWGEFADAQLEYKTKNIVYTLDELEKTGTSDHNGKVEDTILPLLDGRHKIKDDFLGVDVDISDSIVIITTNKFNKLSEPLRDRISYKFKIAPYTDEEKAAIAKFKFDRSMKYHKMDKDISVENGIFDLIAKSVTDQGGREATDIAENIAHKVFIHPKKEGEKLLITKEMVQDWLTEFKNAA